ncbi:UPF0696 protein C11orf68 homolog [Aspergillus udagawae]|nr:uncharacterized protein Aud_003193 [Aspergillus udagawae]GFF55479.1 UPF0696 protein C11orf68 homolog [Aspergillus udagawae]GFF94783.1 UPF0696 protein C11orf68 homolog [Aspergillus udagawae]GFG11041.1 UPF0696 protein C11orf68 homolog [Aspergillus udagawae]GFG23625.1 UPF0696 protein C11orf68 homolog [Aspergillus udagawae]GIC86817.1 hypothetical protein Aud_003193 [Aspergillus udagawae]
MSKSRQATNDDLDEIFSDESSFYGDDAEKSRLEELARSYDPVPYWTNIHPNLLSTIQHELRAPEPVPTPSDGDQAKGELSLVTDLLAEIPPTTLRRNARSPKEPVHDFLARLPPSTTKEEDVGPWVYVTDPHRKADPDEQAIANLVREGTELLHRFEDQKAELEAEHDRSRSKSKAALTRKLNPLRRTLEQDIFALARKTGVVSGKWMMFITADRVDRYWEAVVTGTVSGQLGDAAKVATDDGSGRPRLIAIYTRDYADRQDVKRVLEQMVDLGLVKPDERPVYYKCDAFTYLRIMSDNPYGLKASMASSRDMLAGKV